MTRSLKKGPFVDHHLVAKADKAVTTKAVSYTHLTLPTKA